MASYWCLCLVHVIWTEHRISKLVLNVKYLLLLSFLTAAEFYNLVVVATAAAAAAVAQSVLDSCVWFMSFGQSIEC